MRTYTQQILAALGLILITVLTTLWFNAPTKIAPTLGSNPHCEGNYNRPDVRVQVGINDPVEKFNSAIYYTCDEFEALTSREIDEEKERRIQKHKDFIYEQSRATPTPEPSETPEP